MNKRNCLFILMIIGSLGVSAQQDENSNDTFFLAKKKGLLGKLGRSIATYSPTSPPIKLADPFKQYNGKIIRFIEIVRVGFNQNLNDTGEVRTSFAVRMAQKIHKNTREDVIRKNLFFHTGDPFLPLLVSDNERFLRDLPYLQDAVIKVYKAARSKDSVDVIILTRDIFSVGGSFSASGFDNIRPEIRDENVKGTGYYAAISGIYDKERHPAFGVGGEITCRNIAGNFLDLSGGFKTFKTALVNGRYEETNFFTRLEKPLVNRYTQWTGAFEASFSRTSNAYSDKELYLFRDRYQYLSFDVWGGYNIGYGRKRFTDSEKRLRHFIAARTFYNRFDEVPQIFKDSFDYNYANLNGILFSYSLYKQNFYRSNFIYGFGRNEDVPIGINATVTTGWTNKQGRMRGYYGADFSASSYSKKGFFTLYQLRAGTYRGINAFEDVSLLLSINHFTKLRKINKQWLNRNFVSLSYTKLFKTNLNEPLFLASDFGLPYFTTDSTDLILADTRATIKLESVFFNLRKFLGFRFAPFVFTEFSFLKPIGLPMDRTSGYTSLGGGVRTRNENLIFGTVELRGYYFPRIISTMSRWKVQLSTNLKFRYNSSFIKKPDFAEIN